jgi:hypothetical protein
MSAIQREQNPDVNSYTPDVEPGESPGTTDGSTDGLDDIERKPDQDIPIPPDAERKAPVEEPPGSSGAPVGDVDDSPKRIV